VIIGNKTIQYAIYDRSNGRPEFVMDTTSYKRPSLEMLTDTQKGAGIMGEIDLPTLGQLGSMESELVYKKTNKKSVGMFSPQMHEIEVRWVSDALDSSSGAVKTEAHKEIIKYIPKKFELGDIETNTANEATLTVEIYYYQYIVNGESLIEIDKLNNVLKILGVDYTAAIRQAL
jgi:P2 family phage contractile tail tube protein